MIYNNSNGNDDSNDNNVYNDDNSDTNNDNDGSPCLNSGLITDRSISRTSGND